MKPNRRQLSLREWEPTLEVRLDLAERDALQSAFPSLTIRPHERSSECYDLIPGSEVGTARLGSLSVEIRPKVAVDRLLFLISYASNPKAWRATDFGFRTERGLFEAVIPGFVLQVQHALSSGLLHGYRTTEDALMTLRGRIRVGDQIRRRFGLPIPLEVRYGEFTSDIEENRLLRAAAAVLGRQHIRSMDARRSLRATERLLAPVPIVNYDRRQLPNVAYTRRNEHYRPAVELAKLILRGSSIESGFGPIESSSFVVDMNRVFEDFVVTALREELGLSERVLAQGDRSRTRLWLDEAHRVPLKPDVSWWDSDGRCAFVGDVKYKRTTATGMPNADVYQMFAYATAADLPTGLLIYQAGEAPRREHRIVNAGKTIQIESLDVSEEPNAVLAQISQLGAVVRELRQAAMSRDVVA
jgi:5-methylcytosine-specific restriction enzyme subunit McrC